jgi:TPR repeat protein
LTKAAEKGIHSSYFYLGLMNLEGIHPVKSKSPGMALEYYVKGAARNNAYCYFELSRIYGEGEIVKRDERLQFTYLKRAASEGFVTAQHLLGIA